METELINFYDYRIIPCHNCSYECVQEHDPQKDINAPCPIWDDVQAIWKQAWASDILLLFVPTYGGLPPALWVTFTDIAYFIGVTFHDAYFREATFHDAQEVKKELEEDEVIFIAGMCIPCFVKQNPWLLSDNPEDFFSKYLKKLFLSFLKK